MRRRAVPVWASLLALALGGFGIGTTEFASMGVLPDIAGDLGYTAPAVVGAVLAVVGLVMLNSSVVVERRGSIRADIPPTSSLARRAA